VVKRPVICIEASSYLFVPLCPDNRVFRPARTAGKAECSEFILSLDGGHRRPYELCPGEGEQATRMQITEPWLARGLLS
jgi:hypothetical protein